MNPDRKSGLITATVGLAVAVFGIAVAAATNGAYIAVGGIVVGLLMAVRGLWAASRLGLVALAVLLVGGLAFVQQRTMANRRHWDEAQASMKTMEASRLADLAESSDSGAIRFWAVAELPRAPGRRSLDVLVKTLDVDPAQDLRSQNAVRRFWGEMIAEGPRFRDFSMQARAIESLEALDDPRAIPGLLRVLDDARSKGNHQYAVKALEEIAEQRLERAEEWKAWWAGATGRWRSTKANRDTTSGGRPKAAPLQLWTTTGIVAFRDDDSDGTALIVGCHPIEGKVQRIVGVDWGSRAYVSTQVPVRYRVGGGAVRAETWPSADYLTYRANADPLLDEMRAAGKPTFEIEAETSPGRRATFATSTEGLDQAIGKVECQKR